MPADTKEKSTARTAPYRIPVSHRSSFTISPAMPMGTYWQSGQQQTIANDFVSNLSAYLKLKNEAYKRELGSMEEALNKAEETTRSLKATIDTLGQTIDALGDTLTALCKAAHTLSASLLCTICYETCTNPTSLKCGHSFCRDCLQSWFLIKFESKCEEKNIKLTDSQYSYIYMLTSTAGEAEHNMLNFSKLSNRIKPAYICPSCRDPMLPSIRNSFLDFKLTASLTSLSALIGYVPSSSPGWKLAGIDFLAFLNSRFFGKDYGQPDYVEIIEIEPNV